MTGGKGEVAQPGAKASAGDGAGGNVGWGWLHVVRVHFERWRRPSWPSTATPGCRTIDAGSLYFGGVPRGSRRLHGCAVGGSQEPPHAQWTPHKSLRSRHSHLNLNYRSYDRSTSI